MKVAAIQHDIVWENPEANFERLAPQIAGAAASGARLVVLTEMYSTGFMNTNATSEEVGGPSASFLQAQAKEHDIWVGGTLSERSDDAPLPFNTFVLASPGGDVERYRKIHPFTYSGEHEHFAAGDSFVTVDVEGVRVTPFICYDLRFADEFWATAAGTDCYVVPANWPQNRRHHWIALLRARAIENQAYVVGCNRVGDGGNLHYTGDSRIIDPMGDILAAGSMVETVLTAEIEPDHVRATRQRFPFLPDRR